MVTVRAHTSLSVMCTRVSFRHKFFDFLVRFLTSVAAMSVSLSRYSLAAVTTCCCSFLDAIARRSSSLSCMRRRSCTSTSLSIEQCCGLRTAAESMTYIFLHSLQLASYLQQLIPRPRVATIAVSTCKFQLKLINIGE